jgi:hypothetical protein
MLKAGLRILALRKISALRPAATRASPAPIAAWTAIAFLSFACSKLLGWPRRTGLLGSGTHFGRRDIRVTRRSFDRFRSALFGRTLAGPILSTITPAVAPTIASADGPVVFDRVDIFAMFLEEIRYVQESVALKPQIHKCGLHSGKHARDTPFMDAARQRVFLAALEIDLN